MYFVDLFETHKPSMMFFILLSVLQSQANEAMTLNPQTYQNQRPVLKNGIFSLPCQNVWTIFVPHDFIFCSFLRLNRSQRCFDSICPIERWPKSGSRSSGSTEFCSNFEMSRQEFTILQDVLCTEMLSHIVSSSIWLDVEPLNSSVDRFQQRNWSCRSNRIRGEGSQTKTFFWVNDMDDGESLVFGSL